MRVLLTGHNGYIGSVLVPLLRAHGHEVQGLDTDYFRACRIAAIEECTVRQADIRDALRSDLQGCEAVIHLAGLSNDPLGDLDPTLTHAINTEASLRLHGLAGEAGVRRFVFASTCSVYGGSGQGWLDERSPVAPLTPYAWSKLRVERGLCGLNGSGPAWVCLRLATVYGPSPYLRFDLVLNNLVAYAVTQGHILLKSDGQAWRPLVHVDDVCQAFLLALEAPARSVERRTFNVGSNDQNFKIHELAQLVYEALPRAPIRHAPGAGPDTRSYRVDCQAFHQAVGFVPRWDVPRGIRQLAERYLRLGLGPGDFEGPRYSRLAHLRGLRASGRLDADGRWT